MVLNKKGISPLIATVLIIGFTVALAAVIMVWGSDFIKSMTEGAQTTADLDLICSNEVAMDVSNACNSSSAAVDVTIANNGARDITGLAVRAYSSASDLESVTIATDLPLVAAGADTFTVTLSEISAENVLQVEVIPTVQIEGKDHTCPTSIAKFPTGSLPDTALDSCP